MALVPEVQALVEAVTTQGVAITEATTELTTVEAQVIDLKAQIAGIVPGVPVDAEDLAAIVASTDTIVASVASIKAAMPVPVPPPVVDAVTGETSATDTTPVGG